jgi:hypothetical protein
LPDQTSKPQFRHLAYALGGLALLFLFASWNLPLEAGKCPDQQTQHNPTTKHCSQDKAPTVGFRFRTFVADLWDLGAKEHGFEFLIAAFTLALAAFTWRLASATLRLVTHTPQIERAYVSGGGSPIVNIVQRSSEFFQALNGLGIPNPPTLVPTGEFQLIVNNHGKTAAEILEYGIGFCEAETIPSQPNYTVTNFQRWIAPGTNGHPIIKIPIPQEFARPVIYGRFYYKDIFRDQHSAGFILELDRTASKSILAPEEYTKAD